MGQLKLTPVEYLTYDDYAALPDDGKRWELIEGELVLVPAPGELHQAVSASLVTELYTQLRKTGEGLVYHAPFDVILGPGHVVQPDAVVVRRSRKRIVTPLGIEGAPDLMVEIVSPSSIDRDRRVKKDLYARHRVPEFWLVDPEAQTIEVLVLARGRYSLHALFVGRSIVRSKVFPKLAIRLADLFAPL